ncbi:DUF6115 domain-containing protein [Ornithinibacillus halophilus]|uniref:Uncharacterized protein n=1 Tax=Ornithinibacillus halophilus TaxID=930117 RepID=A0A1M5CBS9_9BACI|nr:hypothetical protein [Ornithinibacillus halophilus]SHF52224.1 hypothetical protein SAMN05216225_1001169 [Ornithinibacillus halophilus]
MTSLLLVISFILHFITIATIYLIFKQGNLLKPDKPKDNPKEVLELLELYVEEIKEENRRLQEALAGNTPTIKNHTEEINNMFEDYSYSTDDNTTDESNRNEVTEPILADHVEDEVETSVQARILQLYHEGLSEEEIARKLNCGKTEVELTIKLHKK